MLTKYNGREGRCQVAARGARPRGGHSHGRPRSQPGFGQGAGDPAAQGRLHLAQAHPRLALWTLFNLPPVLEHSSGQLVKCPTAAFH